MEVEPQSPLPELGLWQFFDIGESEPGLATRDQLSLPQSALPAWGPCYLCRRPHSKFCVSVSTLVWGAHVCMRTHVCEHAM